MPEHTLEQWEQTQAELEIRRWLYKIGLWAPGAERFAQQLEAEARHGGVLTDDEIDQVLCAEVVGRIGCHADGKTYVVPIAYAYDGKYIYAHSGQGQKLRMLRANPAVCFEVDHVENLTHWQSVIAWGRFEELHGAEADRAMGLLAERIKPLIADKEHQLASARAHDEAAEKQRPVVYRIALTERTGRYDKRP